MPKELISPQAVEKALLFAAVIPPLAGLIVGLMLGAHEKCAWPKALAGALIGGIGTLVWAMWHVYGAITDALGLDSVANLCLQLVLFAALGAAIGATAHAAWKLIKRAGA